MTTVTTNIGGGGDGWRRSMGDGWRGPRGDGWRRREEVEPRGCAQRFNSRNPIAATWLTNASHAQGQSRQPGSGSSSVRRGEPHQARAPGDVPKLSVALPSR